jgi:mannan endo-1,4-beta-mannosidase
MPSNHAALTRNAPPARKRSKRASSSFGPNGKNADPYADYFPGARFADMFATDNYDPLLRGYYDDLVQLAGGKPIALGEIGSSFPVDALDNQPRWTWFMGWSDILDRESRDDARKELNRVLFADPRVLNRGDAVPGN